MERLARPATGWRVAIGREAPWIGATGVVRCRFSGVGEATRLPGDELIELELRCGLRQRVPVRERFEQIVPGGRSAGRSDSLWRERLPQVRQDASTGSAVVTKAIRRNSAPHCGHSSGKMANSRASRIAQWSRAVRSGGVGRQIFDAKYPSPFQS